MKKVLVLYAHPLSRRSRVNRMILDQLQNVEGVTIHDLYEEYPYFHINVKKEQELLRQHDLVVWQHPFYWFGMPPLMKLWCDEVLRKGFAYGPEGHALQGKDFLLSLTMGGLEDPATPTSIEAFFPPYQQTVQLCGMRWLNPVVMYGTGRSSDEDIVRHAEKIRGAMTSYCAGGPCAL
ncbi:NAD(P)H-dependent oxidoreductase [Bdellovibrio sp. 22V]|uniref:NAD(P)H-dependent oxidoreductase n=1 Tax=Bdellovibrio TaxID=958 RepID=UPI0025436B0D|nr:NAD(P)H-dependent oxidoreductase [Bdellovibrio sp. 22V]WII71989.1 NAD(P)H-dependent oxidoreductase [Bdellovibrio sp. 22V]